MKIPTFISSTYLKFNRRYQALFVNLDVLGGKKLENVIRMRKFMFLIF